MNQLNKLTFQTTESDCSDIAPLPPSGSDSGIGTASSQFLWHLLTIVMILAALAFPYYIQGEDDWLSRFNFFNKGAIADSSVDADSDKAADGTTSLSANTDPDTTTSLAGTSDSDPSATSDSDAVVAPAVVESETAIEPADSSDSVETKPVWIPVDSSDIVAVRHNPQSKQLDIEFNGGRIYQYSDVPPKVFNGLMKAKSHGRYFARKIKNAGYEVKKLD